LPFVGQQVEQSPEPADLGDQLWHDLVGRCDVLIEPALVLARKGVPGEMEVGSAGIVGAGHDETVAGRVIPTFDHGSPGAGCCRTLAAGDLGQSLLGQGRRVDRAFVVDMLHGEDRHRLGAFGDEDA